MRIDDTWLFNPLKSPSSWAEWVEIPSAVLLLTVKKCLRPRGRSGLKSSFVVVLFPVAVSPSSWAEWVEINSSSAVTYLRIGLRPRGRSGLKSREAKIMLIAG